MINYFSIFFISALSIIPFSLITGPAIPDLTITFSGIFFLFLIIYTNNLKKILQDKLIYFSIFFWIFLLLITFTAENKYLSFRDSLIFIRILFIPILILYLSNIDEKFLYRVILIIFVSTIFVSIDTFYQFVNYKSEFGFGSDLLGFKSDWYGRLTGPFGDELIPGAFLSKFSFIGLLYIFLKNKKNIKLKILSTLYLSFIGLIIFSSGERMALATFLMGVGFLFLFYSNKRVIFFSSFILIVFLIFMTTKIHPFYNDSKIIESTPYHLGLKVEKTFSCEYDQTQKCKKTILLQPEFTKVIKNFNISAYGEIYKVGLEMFKDHKLFGVGLNNFTYLCQNDSRYRNSMAIYSCPSHPHNIYLQWLIETGIFGLLFFIIYLINLFYLILKNKSSEYYLISMSTILILFWPIMSTGSLLKNWNGVSTFFIVGLCLSISRLKNKTN